MILVIDLMMMKENRSKARNWKNLTRPQKLDLVESKKSRTKILNFAKANFLEQIFLFLKSKEFVFT